MSFELGWRDRPSAARADAIRPGVQAEHRGVELRQVLLEPSRERLHLRALEGDRGTLGIVLVVGVGVERRFNETLVLAPQADQPLRRTAALAFESLPSVHWPQSSSDSESSSGSSAWMAGGSR